MSIFANSTGLFYGKMDSENKEVITGETIIENSFYDPIIELSTYDRNFNHGRNIDEIGWQEYYNNGEYVGCYQVFVPVKSLNGHLREESTAFIIVIKEKEAAIFALMLDNLNRKEISARINWAMKNEVYGNGRKNILHSSNFEVKVGIINEGNCYEKDLPRLLEEFGMKLLLENEHGQLIMPEKTFDGTLGYENGKWYVIRHIGSWRYYEAVEEIFIPTREVRRINPTKASTKYTIYKDHGMTVVTLYEDGELSAKSYRQADLMKLDESEYSPAK